MFALGVILAAVDLMLWRYIVAGSGSVANDATCTDSWGENGAKCARPFWNATVSLARSLSSIARSAARAARCMCMRSTSWLILWRSTTTRRSVRLITQGGIIYGVVSFVSLRVVEWALVVLALVCAAVAWLLSGRGL